MLFRLVVSIFFISHFICGFSQLSVTEVGFLPEAVSNNAQCEGFVNGVPYLYSFGGIDTTKSYQGIHLRSYRYNTLTNTATQLPDLPDTLGKIAAAANRVGDTIYISGGYHVFQGGNEVSSNKMHRFNTVTNQFMPDAPNIPQATDDHVQVVWRDSLVILITGWKNTGNITDVQIFNPSLNAWSIGTPIPNNHFYKSFGASGEVLGDTIYYFGGARSSFGFTIQNIMRKGVINPTNPTQITWSDVVIDPNAVGYRMAATTVGETLHWLGGSAVTYNYNGIAYNNSGGVPPVNRDLYATAALDQWQSSFVTELPMDLRGIANVNDSLKFIGGGMIANQTVTDKVYKLNWDLSFLTNEDKNTDLSFQIFPIPFNSSFTVTLSNLETSNTLVIYDLNGKVVLQSELTQLSTSINANTLAKGLYLAKIETAAGWYTKKIVKLN